MISSKWVFSLYILLLFSGSCITPASAKPPSIVKFLSGITSNTLSALFKWLWSLKQTNKIRLGMPNRSMMKSESGYSVETVFDGSKLGIEPYSVEVTQSGQLLVLDSENSNIHKISTPLSRYSEPKLVAGSYEGYSGHVDDKPLEAKMNHPKGFTVDDTGNIYVADTRNMAIRKITDSGVVTIAGGRGNDVKFSNDFDVIYVSSICSILVVDRGYQAIREIKLHDDDCYFNHYDGNLHLVFSWVVVLSVAVFFGFMLALLQTRITAIISSSVDPKSPIKSVHPYTYQNPIKSVRPPLIRPEDNEHEKEDAFFNSLGKMFTGLFSSSKNKPLISPQINYQQPPQYINTWPIQENIIIPHEYSPPLLQTRDPKTRKPRKLMTRKPEKARQIKQGQYIYGGYNKRFDQQYHQMHYLSGPQTYYEETNETTNEVVFGAVQEDDRTMLIKTIDYSNPSYDMLNLRSRYNYMGYPYDMY